MDFGGVSSYVDLCGFCTQAEVGWEYQGKMYIDRCCSKCVRA